MNGWFSWECTECHAACTTEDIAQLILFADAHQVHADVEEDVS